MQNKEPKITVSYNLDDSIFTPLKIKKDDKTVCDLLRKYVKGDCRICIYRGQLNGKFSDKSSEPCCDCDEMEMVCWELDVQRLSELI